MNRDESIDRLLRRTVGAHDVRETTAACLDAETLAAMADGSLTSAQRAAAEAHVADCDRCLAVVAAMAKTGPPPVVTHRPSWFSIRWLVPLTSAAVAVTAWLVIQPAELHPEQATEQTQQQRSETPARNQPSSGPEPEAGSQKPGPTVDALAKREDQRAAADPSRNEVRRQRPSQKELADTVAPPPQRVAEPAAPAPSKPLERAEAADELNRFAAASAPTVVVSSDPNVRWRVAGASVQRSTDGGRTWTPQSTGTTDQLLAGSSPAPDVCWIVGRNGLVLLTTDGRTWRRLDAPETTIDLVGVTAVDAAIATVSTADGRTYRTSNAGRTWTLQETAAAPF